MSITDKKISLSANGIEVIFDVYTDMYRLRRTKPAEVMQLTLDSHTFDNAPVSDIYNMFDQHLRYQDDFVNLGPTNKELRDPRIRNAWEELQIIRKLIGTYERI